MTPLSLWILYTYANDASSPDPCHARLYADRAAAQAAGEKWQAAEQAAAKGFGQEFTFMVLALEGALA